jgi:acyl-CoA-dependent ceramide synthase
MLNYLNLPTACDIAFGVFILSWFVTRHIFYNLVCWSIRVHVPSEKDMPYGCFDSVSGKQISSEGGEAIWSNIMASFDNPGGEVCFNNRIRVSFLSLLMALQVITLLWFGMIIRVAYRVIAERVAADTRLDVEGEDEEEEDELSEEEVEIEVHDPPSALANGDQKFIVEEVDGSGVNLTGVKHKRVDNAVPVRRSSRKSPVAKASGISIPGHSDKKELLGRIGCDKPA